MTIAIERVGTWQGHGVDEAKLVSTTGVEVSVITWGVTVRDWRVPVGGVLRPVALGFETFDPYPVHSPHFGALVGRVANRIADAKFTLDGKTYSLPANEGPNCLHGGPGGLGRVDWDIEPDTQSNAISFTYTSPDGEMGFPGRVKVEAVYRLEGYSLSLDLSATTDRPTPLSLVQHHYFNLGTGPDVLDHTVQIDAPAYSEVNDALLPTGALLPVSGTPYDLRTPRTLRDASGAPVDYDLNLALATRRDPAKPVASVVGPDEALRLELFTDRPGVQFYNGVMTDCPVPGLEGRRYGKYSGLCLEDQAFPGALAHPHFPSIIITPDNPYRHRCRIAIAPN
ncbi:aldose epimerase family protein [Pelagibacterium limicola]|uniref:aldose epimerase family protein n=1 Tax=Pelagibacterium limicola TaxID=2791022 RepID=UPI0018AFFB7F|nr:aldose epimerase family protein [Pelagibacterium limicola]